MEIKKVVQNSLLIIASFIVILFIAEFGLRLVFEPVNFLKPVLIHDENLGHVIEPGSAGHDAWGFRNKTIPQTVDVLAIGDSQTYGVSATSDNSWPAWVARMTGKSVYNMSLGGYGPIQYKYLYENIGVKLKPSLVVVGLYFGNDFFDVKKMVTGTDRWQYLSKHYPSLIRGGSNYSAVNLERSDTRLFGGVRGWLSSHSLFYRVSYYALENTILHSIRISQLKEDSEKAPDEINVINYGGGKVTGVRPSMRINGLDVKNKQIVDAFELSLTLLKELKDLCLSQGVAFSVLIIPTKELVYFPYYSGDQDDLFHEVVSNEKIFRKRAKTFFRNNRIDYIDSLPSLRDELPNNVIYPSNLDGHPNKNGYRAIAKSIVSYFDFLKFANSAN